MGINYNSLNLPSELAVKNIETSGKSYYTYTASGVKLRTVHLNSTDVGYTPVLGSTSGDANFDKRITTDYVGNIIYEQDALKRILIDGGYIEGGLYYFYVNDHLGNNRVVVGSDGQRKQQNHYYPFGMTFADSFNPDIQPYKYNGKEFEKTHELNMYDYSARYYDPALGRFSTVDPLAEKYYSISPYVYCLNNPLKYIDPNGDSVRVHVETIGTGHAWITVGEGDDMVVYSYEPLERDNIKTSGNLRVMRGKHAQDYMNSKKKGTNMNSYVVTDISDETMTETMDNITTSAKSTYRSPGDNSKGTTDNYIIDEYNLFSNNCTTFASDALNKSGSEAMETTRHYPSPTPMIKNKGYTIKERIVTPHYLKGFLNSKSPSSNIYRSYRRQGSTSKR
ncbi:RHS repeat-associated core domain-containing protein [Dysgonomonas sp. PF1-14]|uniref:RHS repeat-associated core domain-containing protein n=1 Tax=Dysgonomonas sp. PF1-14 TaxID=2940630 RepID=UPI0024751F9D|nr:RHS repeat-associated core domain-containing protein [Dysgonomonas sp. PF1-14]